MITNRVTEEVLTKSLSIPYARIVEVLKSGWQICQRGDSKKRLIPNRFVLFFNPLDRKPREKYEDVFIHEITRDIIYLRSKMNDKEPLTKVQVEISTEIKLEQGRIRLECYRDGRLLYRFEQEEDIVYSVDSNENKEEWNAVDILPKEEGSGKCVLIVDDEPVLCAVLQKMLTRLNYHVVSAPDGLEATKILSHMNIDLVISDLRMPKMDGWALMKHVKKNLPDLPFVLITGYHSIHSQNRAAKNLADGYISKPFSFDEIKEMLETVLEEKSNRKTTTIYISK